MHKDAAHRNKSKREQSNRSFTEARMAQFELGDFVLYANVIAPSRGKLKVTWCGPAEVSGTTSKWIFTIRNLATGDEREAHSSRLRFYADQSLQVTEELLSHIAHNAEGHVVDNWKTYITAGRQNVTNSRSNGVRLT
uniref:AlNc14C671G12385 protein n=1 Tax=Albugo laibachii Nc14 TaxID=890382 RepID=F0X1R8_9STRA|nr:AlNc14C671G12385 [Albugo laibachii Nc14]|eukprot:CCA27770.1 AlNc14C671G12385 [Albugo laibachii Nc14]